MEQALNYYYINAEKGKLRKSKEKQEKSKK